jgi:hypothetical protein
MFLLWWLVAQTMGDKRMRTFDPWIGSKYWSEGLGGVKVLILGESHYGDVGTESPSFTEEVVREWGQEKRHRFFTVTQKLVSGVNPDHDVSEESRAAFWEHVAFYNYVQVFPGPEPRIRPTQEMWSAAVSPFLLTFSELQPQVLVVLGKELRSYLPELPNNVQICKVQHPSSRGFQYQNWQPYIQAALGAAKNVTQ